MDDTSGRLPRNIRDDLASIGFEYSPETMQDILQYAANCASLMGGYCVLDSGRGWELEVELDPDNEDEAWAMLYTYGVEGPPDEEFN